LSESPAASESPELPLLENPRVNVHFITNHLQLAEVVAELAASKGSIAIDAERASGFKYSQRAYLVQIRAANTDIFLIDPAATPEIVSSKEFAELAALMKDREWILHAATQDLPCLNELGLYPGAIFDTELAGRLSGQPRVGLGALTESLLNFRLAKEHSAADWSTRPLPDSWLNYAALDVDLLHELATAVEALLNEQGKLDWAKQEFQALMSFKPKAQKLDRWRGITGLHKVQDRSSLEIARQLWNAREALAQKMDVAPGRLIPDSSILVAATQKPRTRPELAAMKSFSGRASRSYLDTWWDAIQSAHKATELPALKPEKTDALPNHRNWINKYPEADRRLKLAKASLLELSEKKLVPLENLLMPELLRQVSFAPPEDLSTSVLSEKLSQLGARPWQIELTAGLIVEAFNLAETAPVDPKVEPLLEPDGHEEL
jgi:ribonuclease D